MHYTCVELRTQSNSCQKRNYVQRSNPPTVCRVADCIGGVADSRVHSRATRGGDVRADRGSCSVSHWGGAAALLGPELAQTQPSKGIQQLFFLSAESMSRGFGDTWRPR